MVNAGAQANLLRDLAQLAPFERPVSFQKGLVVLRDLAQLAPFERTLAFLTFPRVRDLEQSLIIKFCV